MSEILSDEVLDVVRRRHRGDDYPSVVLSVTALDPSNRYILVQRSEDRGVKTGDWRRHRSLLGIE